MKLPFSSVLASLARNARRHWPGSEVDEAPVLKVTFRTGEGGRTRWFVVNKEASDPEVDALLETEPVEAEQEFNSGRIVYSCFPNSFSTDQEAWEDVEWAIGASVMLEYEHPTQGFQRNTGEREWVGA